MAFAELPIPLSLAVRALLDAAARLILRSTTCEAWSFSRSRSSLDPGAFAEDAVLTDPAVDPATVVPDLEAVPLDRLHQMQVVLAVHLAQHDVAQL